MGTHLRFRSAFGLCQGAVGFTYSMENSDRRENPPSMLCRPANQACQGRPALRSCSLSLLKELLACTLGLALVSVSSVEAGGYA